MHLDVAEDAQGSVLFDPAHFDFVVSSLLDNAVKYSPEDSLIEARLAGSRRRERQGLCLQVCNRSRQPVRGVLHAVFDKYTRFDDQSGEPGLGMGLYLVRQLVQAAGGGAWADRPQDDVFRVQVWLPTRVASGAGLANLSPAAA